MASVLHIVERRKAHEVGGSRWYTNPPQEVEAAQAALQSSIVGSEIVNPRSKAFSAPQFEFSTPTPQLEFSTLSYGQE
jgi:hypothetical protein